MRPERAQRVRQEDRNGQHTQSMERSSGGVAIWGAPASGKTTFLAALYIAIVRRNAEDREKNSTRSWHLVGSDPESNGVLKDLVKMLTDRTFPEPTSSITRFNWALRGNVPLQRDRLFQRWRKAVKWHPVHISLDLVDASGAIFSPLKPRGPIVDTLHRSRGIIFLYDPISDQERGDAFDHTFGVLTQFARQLPGTGRLSHYVAVCCTKFDDARVFSLAREMNIVATDRNGFPYVPDEHARNFVFELFRNSPHSTTIALPHLLERAFDPNRVKYFATSSIGFYRRRGTEVFDSEDHDNVLGDDGSSTRIRGQVHPINVLEPMLWLSTQIIQQQP